MTIDEITLPVFLWPPGLILLCVLALCGGVSVLLWGLVFGTVRLGPASAPHTPILSAVVGLFALLLSFTALDAWRRNDAAVAALLRESQESAAILPLLSALEAKGAAAAVLARQAVAEYLDRSLGEEWGGFNVRASAAAGASLDRVRTAVAQGLVDGGTLGPAWRSVQDRLDGMQQGRTARLVAGSLYGDAVRWGALFLLYTAGAFSIMVVHLDRRRSLPIAIGTYLFVSTVSLSLVAVTEHPYTGWDAVRPDALRAVLVRAAG